MLRLVACLQALAYSFLQELAGCTSAHTRTHQAELERLRAECRTLAERADALELDRAAQRSALAAAKEAAAGAGAEAAAARRFRAGLEKQVAELRQVAWVGVTHCCTVCLRPQRARTVDAAAEQHTVRKHTRD